jgi:hypothetical protein
MALLLLTSDVTIGAGNWERRAYLPTANCIQQFLLPLPHSPTVGFFRHAKLRLRVFIRNEITKIRPYLTDGK